MASQIYHTKPVFICAAGGLDADMDGLLESIALRDAAALENAFYDLKGQGFRVVVRQGVSLYLLA